MGVVSLASSPPPDPEPAGRRDPADRDVTQQDPAREPDLSPPAVGARGGLAERLARLVASTPVEDDEPRTAGGPAGPAQLAEAAEQLRAAVTAATADATTREVSVLAALDTLGGQLREQLGATRAAVGGLAGELPEQVAEQIARAAGTLAAQLADVEVTVREGLADGRADVARLREQIGELRQRSAALTGLEDRLEARLGARVDEAVFALASALLAARR